MGRVFEISKIACGNPFRVRNEIYFQIQRENMKIAIMRLVAELFEYLHSGGD